jgi:hypothetical protein
MQQLLEQLYLCEECQQVFALTGTDLTWHSCPHLEDLARVHLGLARQNILLRQALREAVDLQKPQLSELLLDLLQDV